MEANRRNIPIFPLANVVLFPGSLTPLHIFEPRYRQMTEDALAGDRCIAMAVVLPDLVDAMAGDPAVFPIACAGVIRESRRLDDGRFAITLLGTNRIRILEEPERPPQRLYRVALVEELSDPCEPADAPRLAGMRDRVGGLVNRLVAESAAGNDGFDPDTYRDIDDATYVNALCSGLPLPTREKQVLLQADSIPERLEQLIDILEFFLAAGDAGKVPKSSRLH